MPTPAYVPLANLTLTSIQQTITFSSISQAYKDLVLVATVQTTADGYVNCKVNGATSYFYVDIESNGSANQTYYYSTFGTVIDQPYLRSANPTLLNLNFLDYSATDKNKTILGRHTSPDMTVLSAIRYPSNSAISTITLGGVNFNIGNNFQLFGVIA
jgi:hypothetical protein